MKKMIALMFLLTTPSFAEQGYVDDAKIDEIIISSDGSYGGCLLHLTKKTEDALPNCGRSWVSLSYSGDFTSKADARFLLQNAQLAMALDKTVQVRIDDSKKHNGYCFADVIRLY